MGEGARTRHDHLLDGRRGPSDDQGSAEVGGAALDRAPGVTAHAGVGVAVDVRERREESVERLGDGALGASAGKPPGGALGDEVVHETLEGRDVDLALINCLQLDPRASWRTVGDALKVDPVTVARRWQRLQDSGTAWVSARATGHGRPESCLAFVEVDCTTSYALTIAERLARWPHVLSVEHTSGPGDLTLLVEVRDMAFLSRFLLRSLASVPGIVSSRAHLVTEVFAIGDDWKLQVLDATQRTVMTDRPVRYKYAPTDQRHHGKTFDAVDRQLILKLGEDGRSSIAELTVGTGLSESTVRRRLAELT